MSLSTRQPSIARTASSYKEEVLRTLHSQPNGQLTDDRVGISAALTETLQTSGLPVTAGTISSALGLLRREGRVVIEYGHRSLDNKLVFTSVTVLAEPLDGVATGPSRPVEHGERGTTHQTPDDLLLLRRILRLLQSQPAISDEDLERFQTHIEHLIDENETWEAIAQETEDALLAEVSDLQQRLNDTASEQATLLAQRDAEHAALVESISAAARRDIERAQSETATVKRDIAALQRDARWATEKIARLEKQKLKSVSHMELAKERFESIADLARLRERYVINSGVVPITVFVVRLFSLFEWMSANNFPIVIDNSVLMMLGMRDEQHAVVNFIDTRPEALDDVINKIASTTGVHMKRATGVTDAARGHTAKDVAKEIHAELDREVGPLPR